MQRRLAIARLWYEASSFTPVPTSIVQFRQREWVEGDAARAFYFGTRTELGAAVDFLQRSPAWNGRFLRCAAASPGGPVVEEDLQMIFREILQGIGATACDAVYLSLHGALFGQRTLCADLELVRAVRELIGSRPLAVTFDLHANVAPEIARHVDIVVGYKTHPHVDMYESAERALDLLDATVHGRIRPVVAIRKVGAILNSHHMRTDSGPMAEIERIAREAERTVPGILDVSAFGGFAYADTPCAGAAVAVVADGDISVASEIAQSVAAQMHRRVPEFAVNLPPASKAVEQALKAVAARAVHTEGRPVAVLETSDNPLSGGAGDTPGLFRAVVDQARDVRVVFAFFWDPDLVARCHRLGVGGRFPAVLGGRLTAIYGEPVTLDVEVERLTQGRFRNRGPMEAALEVNLGRTAVLRRGELKIILTAACHAPNDLEYFTLHGIDLSKVDLLAAKAKNHFRAAFGTACAAIIDTDTPGPAMADLAQLPFRHLPAELQASIGVTPR